MYVCMDVRMYVYWEGFSSFVPLRAAYFKLYYVCMCVCVCMYVCVFGKDFLLLGLLVAS